MKAKITKLQNGNFFVETDVFMSDFSYRKGELKLQGAELKPLAGAIYVAPFTVRLGPKSFAKVSVLEIGESVEVG
jgi:hypothetical protein